MDLYPWNCCRTCLSSQTLCPIFPVAENFEKYSHVFFTITGLKVDPTDNLPQVICAECVTFINESTKFRIKCKESYNVLMNGRHVSDIKIEPPQLIKAEFQQSTEIDISTNSDLDDTENTFTDYKEDSPQIKEQKYNIEHTEKDIKPKKKRIAKEQTDNIEHTEKDIMPKKKRIAKSDLSKRKKNDKKEGVIKVNRVDGEFECELCHKKYKSKNSFNSHCRIHKVNLVCEHCGMKFTNRSRLLGHCRAKHGYEKVHKCAFCDYKAPYPTQIKEHERIHTGEKPYSCPHCDARFMRKSTQLQHLASHLTERTVKCDQCPAWFKSLTLMRVHRNRHRAPYTYRCKICSSTYVRRYVLVRHLRNVHNITSAEYIDRQKKNTLSSLGTFDPSQNQKPTKYESDSD